LREKTIVPPIDAMKFLDHNGVQLAYREAGRGDPPVVLIHGMACDHTHLRPQFEHLSTRRRVVTLDLRGHGQSDKPTGDYTNEVFGDDIRFVFESLGLEHPVVIGHSLGGSIALALAAAQPRLLGALVLLDSGVRTPTAKQAELQPFYATLGGADHAELVRQFVIDRLFEPTDGRIVIEQVAATMGATPAHVFLAMAEGVLAFDSRAAARVVQVPSLLVMASRPFADPDEVEALGPNWEVGRVVGSGHFLQLVVPDQVNAMLDRYLNLLEGGIDPRA
jgi:pimeloyl-ACP methyl ester carboxylesterase